MLGFSFIRTRMHTVSSQLGLIKGFIETKKSLKHSGEKHGQHTEKTLLVPFTKEGGVVTTTLTKRILRKTGTKNCLTRITLRNGDMRLMWCSGRGRNGGQRSDNCWSCWGESGRRLARMILGEKVSQAGGVILEGCPNVLQDLVVVPKKPALSLEGLVNWVTVCQVHMVRSFC